MNKIVTVIALGAFLAGCSSAEAPVEETPAVEAAPAVEPTPAAEVAAQEPSAEVEAVPVPGAPLN